MAAETERVVPVLGRPDKFRLISPTARTSAGSTARCLGSNSSERGKYWRASGWTFGSAPKQTKRNPGLTVECAASEGIVQTVLRGCPHLARLEAQAHKFRAV